MAKCNLDMLCQPPLDAFSLGAFLLMVLWTSTCVLRKSYKFRSPCVVHATAKTANSQAAAMRTINWLDAIAGKKTKCWRGFSLVSPVESIVKGGASWNVARRRHLGRTSPSG